MKPSKNHSDEAVACVPKWCNYDNCPVCRLIKKAIIENYEFSKKEWEDAFAEAKAQGY